MDKLPAFQVSCSLVDKTEGPSLVFELSDIELASIGAVTTQWSYLEHVLSMTHQRMCDVFGEEMSKDGMSYSFKRRLRAWFEFLKRHEKRAENTDFFLSIHNRIAALENQRHKIIHGIWDYEESDPASSRVFSTREGLEFVKTTNLISTNKLSEKIGQINYLLTYTPIGDSCIGDLPQTGSSTKGDPYFYAHRSVRLSPEDRERLYPSSSFQQRSTTPTSDED